MASYFARCTKLRHNPNIALAVVSFALFLDYLLLLTIVPVLPVYATTLGLSPVAVGVLFSAKAMAGIFAAPAMGYISDKFGRRIPMIMGLFGGACFTVLFALSTTFWSLLVARLLQGVSSATNTASFALLSDVFPDSKVRGRKIGIAITSISLGVLLGPIYGGFLYEAGGVRLPLLIGAGLLVFDGFGRIFILEPERKSSGIPLEHAPSSTVETGTENIEQPVDPSSPTERNPLDTEVKIELQTEEHALEATNRPPVGPLPDSVSASQQSPQGNSSGVTVPSLAPSSVEMLNQPPSFFAVISNRRVLALSGALFFANGSIALMEVVLPLYLAAELGLSAGAIGGLYAGGNALYVIITVPAARIGEYVGRWKLVSIGCLLMGASMPLTPVGQSLWCVIPLWLVCSGLGMSLVDTVTMPELADVAEAELPGSTGRVFGVAHALTAAGFIVGPLVGTSLLQVWC